MSSSRRDFIRAMGTGLAAAGSAATALACTPHDGAAGPGSRKAFGSILADSELLLARDPNQIDPAPVGYDRLPLEWHQERARALKSRVGRSWRERHPPLQRPKRRLLHGLLPGERGAIHLDPLPDGRRGHRVLVFARNRSGPHRVLVVHGKRILLLLSPRRGRFSEPGPGRSGPQGGPLRVDAGGAEEDEAWREEPSARTGPSPRTRWPRVRKVIPGNPLREHPGRLPGHAAGENPGGVER